MSWTVQELFVENANYWDSLHWNSYNLEAMKSVVAPIACSKDLAMWLVF